MESPLTATDPPLPEPLPASILLELPSRTPPPPAESTITLPDCVAFCAHTAPSMPMRLEKSC
jgi:hypothetical protein